MIWRIIYFVSVNLECVFKEKLRYGSNYFKVHDDREGGADKALKGSKDAHKGLSKKAINIGITCKCVFEIYKFKL